MQQIKTAQKGLAQEKDKLEDERSRILGLVEELKNNVAELQEALFTKEKSINQIRAEAKLGIQQLKKQLTSILASKLSEISRELTDQKQAITLQTGRFWQYCSQLLARAIKKYLDNIKAEYQSHLLYKLREFESASKQSHSQDKAHLFELEKQIQKKEDEISDLKEGTRGIDIEYSSQMESMVRNYTEQLRQRNSQLELAKEALHTLTETNDNLESELSRQKTELGELKRKQQGWNEALVLNNTKFQTEVNSLKHENELLKKHNSSLHQQVEQKGQQLQKTSRQECV
jgi:predicted  nucleic acid-binding Zn-ribbon protein